MPRHQVRPRRRSRPLRVLASVDTIPAHPVTRIALRLLALTALRPGELRAGRWSEIEDLDGKEPVWRIGADRMKNTRERLADATDHVVPLARQAVEALRALRPLSGHSLYLFPSSQRYSDRPISEQALCYLLSRAGQYGRQVPHGWRATFSTVMNELYPADRAVIDLMLAHSPKDRIESRYNRATHTASFARPFCGISVPKACPWSPWHARSGIFRTSEGDLAARVLLAFAPWLSIRDSAAHARGLLGAEAAAESCARRPTRWPVLKSPAQELRVRMGHGGRNAEIV